MNKYKPIRQLMAEGEFRKAMDHIARILQKNPDDPEAKQLEYTCREMVHIQNSCEEDTARPNEISVEEYITVHFRRIMKQICRFIFVLLSKLPSAWRQRLYADRFRVWEISFTIDEDVQKDWLWELLFWDARRRMTAIISLLAVVLLGIVCLCLLAFGGCDDSENLPQNDFYTLIKAAEEDDANAQYLLGKSFYYGENVKRDSAQAVLWLTKAARTGHAEAASLLHRILVKQDVRGHDDNYLWKKKGKAQLETKNDF